MNTHYQIDKDTVVVTDENGQKRKMPKYSSIEQILMLENEVEVIDELIDEKTVKISKNTNKKLYKYGSQIDKVRFIFLFLGDACLAIVLFATMLQFLETSILVNTFLIVLPIAGILYLSGYIRDNIGAKNKQLEKSINYLQDIKKQKLARIKALQQVIDMSQAEKEKTTVPTRKFKNSIELCREILMLVKQMKTDNHPIEDFDAVATIVEQIAEKGKQKRLQMRENKFEA